MKKIKIILLSMLSVILFPACNDFLELYPDDAQTAEQYWNTKGEVEAVVAAGYVSLRKNVEHLFVWGEARANAISIDNPSNDKSKRVKEVRDLTMTNTSEYAKWGGMYDIINMANSVLKYAPVVLSKDPSFTKAEMDAYFTEAYFLRSLAYFYLVRTFKEVPFITQPYVDDKTAFDYAQSTEEEILANIKDDLLNKALPSSKEFYPEESRDDQPNTKGRATRWSIYALLADIYLWEGDYDNCIKMCDYIFASQRVGLIGKELWFTNFYPGNSNESIFEIQYNRKKGQTNNFLSWFGYVGHYFGVSDYAVFLYSFTTPLGDIRGHGGTYWFGLGVNDIQNWKYIGTNLHSEDPTTRASDEDDQNFILYRLADIFFMRAEANIMKGEGFYRAAMDDLAFVRARAGIEEVLEPRGSELEMLDFLYKEKIRELCGEGKTWFDLLRIAKRHNYRYKEYMIENVRFIIDPGLYGVVRSKLLNEGSHYMPIHKDEMRANKLLKQNDYYTGLGYN